MERKDVLRTSMLIQDAYLSLIFNGGKKRITVNDIINKAGVSRSTFYAHYQDIPDLDECVENRITEYIKSFIINTTPEELITDTYAKLSPLLRALLERKDVLHGLIVGGWKPLVLEKIRAAFDGAIDWGEYGEAAAANFETVNICIKGVLLEACYYWSMGDEHVDEELLIKTVCDFVSGGLSRLKEESTRYIDN